VARDYVFATSVLRRAQRKFRPFCTRTDTPLMQQVDWDLFTSPRSNWTKLTGSGSSHFWFSTCIELSLLQFISVKFTRVLHDQLKYKGGGSKGAGKPPPVTRSQRSDPHCLPMKFSVSVTGHLGWNFTDCIFVLCPKLHITGGTVVQPCVNSHWLSQWEPCIFDSPQNRRPLTYR